MTKNDKVLEEHRKALEDMKKIRENLDSNARNRENEEEGDGVNKGGRG